MRETAVQQRDACSYVPTPLPRPRHPNHPRGRPPALASARPPLAHLDALLHAVLRVAQVLDEVDRQRGNDEEEIAQVAALLAGGVLAACAALLASGVLLVGRGAPGGAVASNRRRGSGSAAGWRWRRCCCAGRCRRRRCLLCLLLLALQQHVLEHAHQQREVVHALGERAHQVAQDGVQRAGCLQRLSRQASARGRGRRVSTGCAARGTRRRLLLCRLGRDVHRPRRVLEAEVLEVLEVGHELDGLRRRVHARRADHAHVPERVPDLTDQLPELVQERLLVLSHPQAADVAVEVDRVVVGVPVLEGLALATEVPALLHQVAAATPRRGGGRKGVWWGSADDWRALVDRGAGATLVTVAIAIRVVCSWLPACLPHLLMYSS